MRRVYHFTEECYSPNAFVCLSLYLSISENILKSASKLTDCLLTWRIILNQKTKIFILQAFKFQWKLSFLEFNAFKLEFLIKCPIFKTILLKPFFIKYRKIIDKNGKRVAKDQKFSEVFSRSSRHDIESEKHGLFLVNSEIDKVKREFTIVKCGETSESNINS